MQSTRLLKSGKHRLVVHKSFLNVSRLAGWQVAEWKRRKIERNCGKMSSTHMFLYQKYIQCKQRTKVFVLSLSKSFSSLLFVEYCLCVILPFFFGHALQFTVLMRDKLVLLTTHHWLFDAIFLRFDEKIHPSSSYLCAPEQIH